MNKDEIENEQAKEQRHLEVEEAVGRDVSDSPVRPVCIILGQISS